MNVGDLRKYLEQFDEWEPVLAIKVIHPHEYDGYDGRAQAGMSHTDSWFFRKTADGLEIGCEAYPEHEHSEQKKQFHKRIL